MTEKQYRLNKWGTRLLKNNRPLFNWANESDDIVDLLNKQERRIKELEKEKKELKLQVEMLKQIKPLHKLPKSINLVLKNGGDVE